MCSRIDFKILLISFKALQQPRCKLISELVATTPLDTYFDIDGPEVVANARLTAESVCREGWIRSGSADLNLFLRDSFVNGPYFALKERHVKIHWSDDKKNVFLWNVAPQRPL